MRFLTVNHTLKSLLLFPMKDSIVPPFRIKSDQVQVYLKVTWQWVIEAGWLWVHRIWIHRELNLARCTGSTADCPWCCKEQGQADMKWFVNARSMWMSWMNARRLHDPQQWPGKERRSTVLSVCCLWHIFGVMGGATEAPEKQASPHSYSFYYHSLVTCHNNTQAFYQHLVHQCRYPSVNIQTLPIDHAHIYGMRWCFALCACVF